MEQIGKGIGITAHALERYVERLARLGKPVPGTPKEALLKLLGKAKPEKMGEVRRVLRNISNNCTPADYFTYRGWRFVLVDNTLITVERTNQDEN